MNGAAAVLAMGVNWTAVLVTGVPAVIASVCSGAALVIVSLNRRLLHTPSGPTVASVVERSHELAVVNAARSARIDKTVNGDTVPAEDAPGG